MPRYSSKSILKERILYAIENTTSIDGDTLQHGEVEWD